MNTLTSITIRLEESEKQAIVEFANANDLSMAQVVRRAIKDYLAAQQQEK